MSSPPNAVTVGKFLKRDSTYDYVLISNTLILASLWSTYATKFVKFNGNISNIFCLIYPLDSVSPYLKL